MDPIHFYMLLQYVPSLYSHNTAPRQFVQKPPAHEARSILGLRRFDIHGGYAGHYSVPEAYYGFTARC